MTYNEFMEDWENNRPEYNTFCFDGILVEEKWKNASKIMFLLKETHENFAEINGPQGPEGRSPVFWRNMKMWTYIIDEVLKGNTPSLEEVKGIKEEPNDSIAYVNLKKNAEQRENSQGNTNSDYSDILNYVIKDKQYLLEQINFIKPFLILCSGTFSFCKVLFEDIIKITERLYKVNNVYLIDFYHLSSRGSYKNNYQELLKIVKRIKQEEDK